tara:strand:- start:810 stop:986 length:177 start_codon:yes stop_codon:yes gene_type:complete
MKSSKTLEDLIPKDYKELKEDRRTEVRMYKVRWVWYHTILATELLFVILLLLGILIKL